MKFLSYYNTSTSISDEDISKLKNISKKYPFFTGVKVLLLDNLWNEKEKKEEIKDLLGLTILLHPNRNYLKQHLTREKDVAIKTTKSKEVKPVNSPVKSSENTVKLWKQPIKRSNDIFIEEFMTNIIKAKKAYDAFNEIVEELDAKEIENAKKVVEPKKNTPKKTVKPKKNTPKKTVKPKKNANNKTIKKKITKKKKK